MIRDTNGCYLEAKLAGLPGLSFVGDNPKVAFGLVLLLPIFLVALLAQWLPLPGPLETDVIASLEPPSITTISSTSERR